MTTVDDNRSTHSRILFWIFGGLLLLGVIASLTILLPRFFPKQDCNPPTLTIGTRKYIIKTIQPKSDGSLKVPANQDGKAFWAEGTDTNQVFALSPTVGNLTLETSLKPGDKTIVTWANCNSIQYRVSSVQKGVPDKSTLLDQSISEITIFVQPDSSTAGFVVKGELMEETIITFKTPDTAEIQAEVSLLETATSADGKTIRINISILNNGQSSITLSNSDVSLTSENAKAIVLESSEPALPKEIKAGANETIYLTFFHPYTPTSTLKIFSVEYELDGY